MQDRDKEQEELILNKLSNKLREEITIEINKKILSNYKIFANNFS